MYQLAKTNDPKYYVKFYEFLKRTGVELLPSKDEYIMYCNIGEVCVVLDEKNKVRGGIVQYCTPEFHVVLSYYVPKKARKSKLYYELLATITRYKEKSGKKNTYISSTDVSEYKRMVTHKYDTIYELHIPVMKFK